MTGIYAGGWLLFIISTHILTKRMTIQKAVHKCLRNISTHILTKRMTTVSEPVFQLLSFQLTSSRRGWRRRILCRQLGFYISTHILTKRMTGVVSHESKIRHFNSHPHEEDDDIDFLRILCRIYFNSHPHEEDDCPDFLEYVAIRYFNSHPHEEDD